MADRPPLVLTQRDVTRALKAATAAGVKVGSYEVDHVAGKIIVRADSAPETVTTAYDRWKATANGAR